MSRAKTPVWLVFLAARWKAIAALIVPLAGGLAALAPNSDTARVVGIVVTALVAAGVVHQVPNQNLLTPVTTVVGDVENTVTGVVDDVLPADAVDTGQ